MSHPSEITMEELSFTPTKSIFRRFTTPFIPSVLIATLQSQFFGGPLWPNIIYNHFLSSFGIAKNTLMTDANIRNEVKSKPIVETTMLGPSAIHPNWTDTLLNRAILNEFNEKASSIFEKVENEEMYDLIDLPTIYNLNEDEVTFLDGQGINTSPTYYLLDNNYMLSLAEKHDFKMAIPVFGTDKDFHIPLTPTDGKGTLIYDEVDGIVTDPIDFEGPMVSTYKNLASESTPFTLENLLGMGTDVTGE